MAPAAEFAPDLSDRDPGNALVPELSVRDWRTSRDFYCDLVGFSVVYERPEEGFVYLALGHAELMLDQLGVGRDFHSTSVPLAYPFGRGVNLQIRVPSIDAVLDRLAAESVALHLPLEEKWYRRNDREAGNRQFVVADPDGYLLRLFEELGTREMSE
jgi:catechol 2,3-dioxygenase-like lactoylglutathione lyase family enzyme